MVDVVNVELAAAVRKALIARGWSYPRAARACGMSQASIHKLATGRPLRAENVVRWAQAVGGDPDEWLRLAGYAGLASKALGPGDPAARTLYSEPDLTDDEEEVLGFYRGVPPDDQAALRRMLRADLPVGVVSGHISAGG